MPLAVVVRRRPDSAPARSGVQDKALRSFHRWLRPTDESATIDGFIATAVERAFPSGPKFDYAEVTIRYGYDKQAIGSVIEANDPDCVQLWIGGKDYDGPVLFLTCDTHDYVDLRATVEHMHRRDPEAATWFMFTLGRLPWWIYGPGIWEGTFQSAYWHGESDDEEAIANYGDDAAAYEKDGLPRVKDLEAALPKWAWDTVRLATRCRLSANRRRLINNAPTNDPVRNLRMAARCAEFGVRADALLAADGTLLSSHPRLARGVPAEPIDYPFRFGWQSRDWFERALDGELEMASNSGMGSTSFAWHRADRPERAAADYEEATLPLLRGLDRLFRSLHATEKRYSPLLIKRLASEADAAERSAFPEPVLGSTNGKEN